ncbi:MAG: 3D domain-containing protein, partial [bacterium]
MRSYRRTALFAAPVLAAVGLWLASPDRVFTMEASAYSVDGKQAAGTPSQEGTAAADPDILPLGTKVRVSDKKGLIGEFVITDTGPKVQGHKIDIYYRSDAEARRFGRRRVRVQVLEWGEGHESAREKAQEDL